MALDDHLAPLEAAQSIMLRSMYDGSGRWTFAKPGRSFQIVRRGYAKWSGSDLVITDAGVQYIDERRSRGTT